MDTSPQASKKVKFQVAGLMMSPEFQRSQYLVNKMYTCYPQNYENPEIRPMLNVDWECYLLRIRRRYGDGLWKLRAPVAVFMNGKFLGDDTVLSEYLSQTYSFAFEENFEHLGEMQVAEYFEDTRQLGRHFIHLDLSSECNYFGSILIMLYSDLVPDAAQNFLDHCNRRGDNWEKSIIARIVPQSWVQFNGVNVIPTKMSCENYVIPHDRRGVVSTSNHGKHKDNTTQFHISLDSTPWMDHKYVAFGQVIQGEEVLRALENLKVGDDYAPEKEVILWTSDECTNKPMELEDPTLLKRTRSEMSTVQIAKDADVETMILESSYRKRHYCLETDLRSHLPFIHLPDRLLIYLKMQEKEPEAEEYVPDVTVTPTTSPASTVSEKSLAFEEVIFIDRSKGFVLQSRSDILVPNVN